MNNKFRIYALVHGPILPIRKIFNLEIRKMTFEEQSRKKFSPIQSVFSEREDMNYKTYVTSLPYVDPVYIKSEHIIVCDVEEYDENSALGAAVNQFDKLCRFLSITNLKDTREKFHNKLGGLLPYVYQVNKIYSLDSSGNEIDVNFKLESGGIYLPDRPEANQWRNGDTEEFLNEIYNFHDEILKRALKYLYRSSIGYLVLDSPEKVALDHFKSIEIIINSISNKKFFKNKLNEASGKIGLTREEQEKIIKFWEYRSDYGDVAHFSEYDQTEYSNQFPIPSNVNYPWAFLSSIAGDVCLKYFQYRRGLFSIEIEKSINFSDNLDDGGKIDDVLWEVNPQWESNRFLFHTNEQNKKILKQKVKTIFANKYNIEENNISIEFGATRKIIILRTSVNNF